MSTVKVQTALSSNFGHEVAFGTTVLTFDKLGFAEVDATIANQLVVTYEGWLFIGEKPKVEVVATADQKELSADIARLQEKLADREGTIKALQQENETWKAELEKFKAIAAEATEELEGYKIQTTKQIKELELSIQLYKKTPAELTEFCKTLEIPEERYKGKKSKDELITIILDESRK